MVTRVEPCRALKSSSSCCFATHDGTWSRYEMMAPPRSEYAFCRPPEESAGTPNTISFRTSHGPTTIKKGITATARYLAYSRGTMRISTKNMRTTGRNCPIGRTKAARPNNADASAMFHTVGVRMNLDATYAPATRSVANHVSVRTDKLMYIEYGSNAMRPAAIS